MLSSSIKNVLIADDSATDRKYLSLLLEDLQLNVTAVNSGNEAITTAETIQPDVILLDVIMKNGDGYHACRTIKRNDTTTNIPVIMISSKSNPVDKMWAEKLGASAYVTKPFTNDDLLKALQSI
ncbi:MAG TPA: response regulator [Leucothrix mucor]|uniref:Response regulator n=1 Tax=Leucothrix mucor TaxID=45248 RepID=A0A7V2SZX9_LEUMU|nr:response regulator [Leucothrix mucor]